MRTRQYSRNVLYSLFENQDKLLIIILIELTRLYIINKHISLHRRSYHIAASKQEAVT